jgi:hypothetical protein
MAEPWKLLSHKTREGWGTPGPLGYYFIPFASPII